ncbi:ATP-binding protein [Legionella waltersii]|nr:PAS domain-containing sensor histidine kinase [Legionella waltersii]
MHSLLVKQLKKSSLNSNELPSSQENWVEFIERINKTYIERDQERYLNEHSMEIFSKEMMKLNEELEKAHQIAQSGFWSYDGINDFFIWSKELFFALEISPKDKPQTLKDFFNLIHENDRGQFIEKIRRSLNERHDYDDEIRIRNSKGQYIWVRVIGKPQEEAMQISGVAINIHKNKQAEEEIKALHQKITFSARRAGMAEVATSILHNIGNILNSSNVSINLLKKSLTEPHYHRFLKLTKLLIQNKDDLADFLTNDPKGLMIPNYISMLSELFINEQKKNIQEIDSLIKDLNHIKDIVAMQKTLGSVSTIVEKVNLQELIDSALEITMLSRQDGPIEIVKEYIACPVILADKSKLLQILINLLQNSRDAVLLNTKSTRKVIKLQIESLNPKTIQIFVEDNGVGISSKHIKRIFSFGFTTKENGHGFGLHSSALSAQQMGGILYAESKGKEKGAKFILNMPIEGAKDMRGTRYERP